MKVVVGATASGKSAWAMEYAIAHNGEIVSADSMQIYRELDIGTAKPSLQDRAIVRHHCVDIVQPNYNYSVVDWVKSADCAIQDILSRGKLPVVVGGTGFYVKALLYRQRFAATDVTVRAELQNQLDKQGSVYMHNLLSSVDSVSAARINSNDVNRVLRALEIYYITGKPRWHNANIEKRYDYDLHMMSVDRSLLYDLINKRVDNMIDQGLVQEVRMLLRYKDYQSMQGIGYKQLVDYHLGKTSLQESIALIKQHTRNYAKRQLTWLRHWDKNNYNLYQI